MGVFYYFLFGETTIHHQDETTNVNWNRKDRAERIDVLLLADFRVKRKCSLFLIFSFNLVNSDFF